MTLMWGLKSLHVTLTSGAGLSSFESKTADKAKGATVAMGTTREASARGFLEDKDASVFYL